MGMIMPRHNRVGLEFHNGNHHLLPRSRPNIHTCKEISAALVGDRNKVL
jgi:hypothetical protein